MANVVDYLNSIQKLTNTNLQILKALNDSFYTKQNHLFAEVNDTTYVIPSFISLENKINALQENFENLVKSPETSEAYFNFDGNTRAIEVRKYSHVPDSVKLNTINNFSVDSNDIFKDFLTPVPYVNFDLPTLPNDIVEVNVKKIIAKSNALKEIFKSKLARIETYTENDKELTRIVYDKSNNVTYGDIHKLLLNSKEDIDYIEYDTLYKLPLRKNIGYGTYIIESVISDIIDEDLNNIITLKLKTDNKSTSYMNTLTYKMFDETIEKPLSIGDELINFDGTGKVKIVEIQNSTSTIVVKVVNGEYLNFLGTESYDTNNETDIHDFSKLRFHTNIDFVSEKYVKVPLEEDQYVFIAISPVNSRMNTQAAWGTGLMINTHALLDDNNKYSFKTYYDNNVKNIGDILFEMTSMITSPVTELSEDTFKSITNLKPVLNKDLLQVLQINKHLNNSDTVKNIRSAYNQKKSAEQELQEIQRKIDDINSTLTSISFDDTTGIRAIHVSQLKKLNQNKNELTTKITKAIDSISLNVNNAEIPIENAKYRIRGFYSASTLANINDIDLSNHVVGIRVQYRYKNINSITGNAVSMPGENSNNYIYSDWNVMQSFDRQKIAECVDGNYRYNYEEFNEIYNEPSYNQIDIPISQGETVDIRLKVLYDFGQPYISVTSDWSEIVNIAFPDEFLVDIPILTIIEENNNDIETNRFTNILKSEGIELHVHDVLTDQDITYFHRPDSIASGFYTEERRVIPLKDKLVSLTNDIAELKHDIQNAEGKLNVSLNVGDVDVNLLPEIENNITLEAYNNFSSTDIIEPYSTSEIGQFDIDINTNNLVNDGAYTFDNYTKTVYTIINITLSNTSDAAIKIYPIFPGSRDVSINNSTQLYSIKENYIVNNGGVYFKYKDSSSNSVALQGCNQFLTFRTRDAWDNTYYYTENAINSTNNIQNSAALPIMNNENGMCIYPYLSNRYGLCINSDGRKSSLILNPGEEIIVPMLCEYKVQNSNTTIKKTITFDIRTSLYTDPTNYLFTVTAKNTSTLQDKLTISNRKRLKNNLSNIFNGTTKYFTTVK